MASIFEPNITRHKTGKSCIFFLCLISIIVHQHNTLHTSLRSVLNVRKYLVNKRTACITYVEKITETIRANSLFTRQSSSYNFTFS